MSTMTVRLNTRETQRAFQRLREQAPVAIARALNRAAASATTTMIRWIAADTGVKQKDLRGTTKRNRAIWPSEARPDKLVATVYASTERIPLMDFQARQTKRGVTAKLGASRRLYPGLFVARMGSGHEGVFGRDGKPRLPIRERYGPSIFRSWQRNAWYGREKAREALAKNLQSEFKFATRS